MADSASINSCRAVTSVITGAIALPRGRRTDAGLPRVGADGAWTYPTAAALSGAPLVNELLVYEVDAEPMKESSSATLPWPRCSGAS